MRPHISRRALRACLALSGPGLALLAGISQAFAAPGLDVTAPVPRPGPLPGISATPVGVQAPVGATGGTTATTPGAMSTALAATTTAALSGLGIAPGAPGLAAAAPPRRTSLSIRRAELNVLDGHTALLAGRLRPVLAGRVVALQRRGRHGWRTIARARTGARGRFVLRYVPAHLLSERVRVWFAGDRRDLRSSRYVGMLTSYRLAGASWYGGGGSVACGGPLTSSTLGVANKTLPCGTLVTLRYGGRSVRVPVIDRGPYVAGREFDLTEATKRALGFEGVAEVWSTR